MIHAFMTSLPGALARRAKPEAEIRAEAQQKGLSKADENMEVYQSASLLAPRADPPAQTDNRDWAIEFEDYFKRIAVPTSILVADNKAGGAPSCARK